jgi:AraC-like DNA-binding protein
MDYVTYLPNEVLSPFVKCFWSLEAPASAEPERQRIVPDGCMEMIFHYGDLYKQYMPNGDFIIQPRCFVFGQITEPLEIEPTGIAGIIAARFLPNGFTAFANYATSKMNNKAMPLQELFGSAGHELEEKVLGASSHHQRIQQIDSFLSQQLQFVSVDEIVQSSIEVMLRLKGQLSVQELADNLGTGRRKLERRFADIIGLSPKQLAKIIRLQATLKMLEQNQSGSLTELALDNGYFDQAHFIKDFKEFTGVSPGQFYVSNMKMTALFVGAD